LGCGKSDRSDNSNLWTIERFVEELAEVRSTLELEKFIYWGIPGNDVSG